MKDIWIDATNKEKKVNKKKNSYFNDNYSIYCNSNYNNWAI